VATNWLGPLRERIEILLSDATALAEEWLKVTMLRNDRIWLCG
jgi:hypothetical protein